jgi:hypothetical protein
MALDTLPKVPCFIVIRQTGRKLLSLVRPSTQSSVSARDEIFLDQQSNAVVVLWA